MMKEYLKKLGKTKFQAYLVVTITNLIIFIGYMMGKVNMDNQMNDYMPLINLIVQSVATFIYQWVEGSIDKASAAASSSQVETDPDPDKFIQKTTV